MITSIDIAREIAEYIRRIKYRCPVFTAKNPTHKGAYIAVNTLDIGTDYFEDDIANVNIHVPDICKGVANEVEIKKIADEVLPLITDAVLTNINLYISSTSLMEDVDGHYLNIRILVTHINEE